MSTRADRAWFAACAVVYLAVATRVTDGLARTQFDNGAFAHFFDFQAEALLRGDLALEENAIGLEAFVVDGQEHMYFGLFPALIRMPFLAVSDGWFGQFTVVSGFGAWLLFVAAAWRLTDLVLPEQPNPVAVRIWKLGVALGTPMLALAGTAWVFNEAIMWGVASCTWFQLRMWHELDDPSERNRAWLAGALLLVVLNRPTFGLGCLVVLAGLVGIRALRSRSFGRGEAETAAIAAGGAIVLVTPNLLRFDRLFGPPMEAQGLSMFDEHRMTMLAYTGGDYVDVRYLPTNLLAYLRPDGVSLTARFPFVEAPETIPRTFGGVIHDITYRTPSLVASTPFLLLLAVLGLVIAIHQTVRRTPDSTQLRLVALAAAGVPGAGALVVWGFIAPRYLGDFVPLLLPLALVGLRAATVRRERLVAVALGATVCFSVLASVGIALSTSYQKGYDGDIAEYLDLQGRGGDGWTDGRSIEDPSGFAFDRSDPPPAGEVAVLGECEAVYFSTGEQVDPWLEVAMGPNDFHREYEVTIAADGSDAAVVLATLASVEPAEPGVADEFDVALIVDGDEVRIDLIDEFGAVPYLLGDISTGDTFTLGITSDPVRKVLTFSVDGHDIAYGHVFTRSLYGPSGQRTKFVESVSTDRVVVGMRPAPTPCGAGEASET